MCNIICTSTTLCWSEGYSDYSLTPLSPGPARVYGQYLGLVVSGDVWTPIPTDLFVKTSDNPLGKTEFDPVMPGAVWGTR